MTNEELIKEAVQVVNPKTIGDSEMGGVGCALITDKNTIFKGVCIDTSSGMGFCAEHTAISQMITQGEYKIKKIVAVWKDEKGDVFVIPPCGRCREFMRQTNEKNLETEVVLDTNKAVKLKELLPYYDWWQKIG
ncbi:cytidine deaminase [Candidatus Peregrinibacteria bacterium]|nr:cytidine deaminase [Candidatus Peregrinibacteria bacterium]